MKAVFTPSFIFPPPITKPQTNNWINKGMFESRSAWEAAWDKPENIEDDGKHGFITDSCRNVGALSKVRRCCPHAVTQVDTEQQEQ